MPHRLILTLRGGLGNQLFQYASARAIAARHGLHLALDAFTGFENDCYKRRYELSEFNVQAEVIDREEALFVRRRHNLQGQLWWRIEHLSVLLRGTYWMRAFTAVLGMGIGRWSDLYLNCYLQSYHYFDDIAPLLRCELTLSRELRPNKKDLAAAISPSNSVAVHVRSPRGLSADGAVVRPELASSHLSIEYYRSALADLASRVGAVQTVIFSDTVRIPPTWIEALGSPALVVAGTGADACDDLVLMSLCRHHVIANSTYSWWGAWLGPQADTLTYAPRRWFLTGRPGAVKDLYPRQWIVV